MYISHSSKIPGQSRDELQWEEEEEVQAEILLKHLRGSLKITEPYLITFKFDIVDNKCDYVL